MGKEKKENEFHFMQRAELSRVWFLLLKKVSCSHLLIGICRHGGGEVYRLFSANHKFLYINDDLFLVLRENVIM